MQVSQQLVDPVDRIPNPQTEIGRHLIVPAPTGVELAADVANSFGELPLDVHVDVFKFLLELERPRLDLAADLFQAGDNLIPFGGRQHPRFRQHAGMGDRAADVLSVEATVEADALAEPLDARVDVAIKDAAPWFVLLLGQGGPFAK